jgi:hypothetical protein
MRDEYIKSFSVLQNNSDFQQFLGSFELKNA